MAPVKRIHTRWKWRKVIYQHIDVETKWPPLDDIFKCIFLNDCCRILIEILLEIVLNGAIDNEP